MALEAVIVHAITETGSRLSQEEPLKSHEDEGHVPVGPVELGSQWKPYAPERMNDKENKRLNCLCAL